VGTVAEKDMNILEIISDLSSYSIGRCIITKVSFWSWSEIVTMLRESHVSSKFSQSSVVTILLVMEKIYIFNEHFYLYSSHQYDRRNLPHIFLMISQPAITL
jgi:hypothetical protein